VLGKDQVIVVCNAVSESTYCLTISGGIAVADMSHRGAKKALAGYKSIEGETYIMQPRKNMGPAVLAANLVYDLRFD
jgi:hypothetical protein